MKISCKILGSCRNTSFLGYSPAKYLHNVASNSHYSSRILSFPRIDNETQKVLGLPSSNFRHSRSFSLITTRRGASLVALVAPKVRDFSMSVDTSGNDHNKHEKICAKNKERIEKDGNIVREEEDVKRENSKVGENVSDNLRFQIEETELEKEAWKLLKDAVVNYCGSPVGTLAANDPSDNMPLNYDQVFVRDFIPAALAFLLKGEKEIVKNFLIHNLQLQVLIMPCVV